MGVREQSFCLLPPGRALASLSLSSLFPLHLHSPAGSPSLQVSLPAPHCDPGLPTLCPLLLSPLFSPVAPTLCSSISPALRDPGSHSELYGASCLFVHSFLCPTTRSVSRAFERSRLLTNPSQPCSLFSYSAPLLAPTEILTPSQSLGPAVPTRMSPLTIPPTLFFFWIHSQGTQGHPGASLTVPCPRLPPNPGQGRLHRGPAYGCPLSWGNSGQPEATLESPRPHRGWEFRKQGRSPPAR